MAQVKDLLAASLTSPLPPTPLATINSGKFTTFMVPFTVGGSQPSGPDSVACQLWMDGSGELHVYTGTVWKKLKYDP